MENLQESIFRSVHFEILKITEFVSDSVQEKKVDLANLKNKNRWEKKGGRRNSKLVDCVFNMCDDEREALVIIICNIFFSDISATKWSGCFRTSRSFTHLSRQRNLLAWGETRVVESTVYSLSQRQLSSAYLISKSSMDYQTCCHRFLRLLSRSHDSNDNLRRFSNTRSNGRNNRNKEWDNKRHRLRLKHRKEEV